MAAANPAPGSMDELVSAVTLYRRRPRLLHGTVLPFVAGLYPAWLWLWGPRVWAAWAGVGEPGAGEPEAERAPPEAALLALAAIGVAHLLTALSGLWSVHAHCALTCVRVRHGVAAWGRVSGSRSRVKGRHVGDFLPCPSALKAPPGGSWPGAGGQVSSRAAPSGVHILQAPGMLLPRAPRCRGLMLVLQASPPSQQLPKGFALVPSFQPLSPPTPRGRAATCKVGLVAQQRASLPSSVSAAT